MRLNRGSAVAVHALASCLALAPSAALCAEPAALHRPAAAVVPFLYEDARIYVPVRIGSGSLRWFILDTGATDTIIDSAIARDEHLSIEGSQTVRGAGSGSSRQGETASLSLTIGDVPMQVAQPQVLDLAHLLGPTSGRAPAGIIGAQFFREHFLDVDFAARQMRVEPAGVKRRSQYSVAVPLRFVNGTPLTTVSLVLPGGRTVRANALVDLGAKSTFLIPEPFIDREKLRGAFARAVVTGFGAGVGGDTFYAFVRARSLSFAGVPGIGLDRPVIGLSVGGTLRSTWNEGLLGAEFLSRFRLGFDYRRKRLLLSPVHSAPPLFDRSGMFIVAAGDMLDHVAVREILPDGPAAAAGLAKGDEILAVDGQLVRTLGLAKVREILRQPHIRSVTIAYRRGSEERSVRLKPRDLL